MRPLLLSVTVVWWAMAVTGWAMVLPVTTAGAAIEEVLRW